MNWMLLAAGGLLLIGAGIHGWVGDRIVRNVDAKALRGRTRFLIRVTWHFTTIAFAIVGIALAAAGADQGSASLGATYVAGALVASWALFALVTGFVRGGTRSLLVHPAPSMLTLAAALIWLGATSL